ncbi:MAG: TolC family protein [Alphaproteobacteria bacterium]|nr:TolC family protein [Alphaproteobacteria bacterium]
MEKLLILLMFFPCVAFAADDCAELTNVPDSVLTLSDVIDLGLCRNPQTAAAYASLRAQRFTKDAAYSNYLPRVELGANANRSYEKEHWQDWSYGASLSASYLLFDFGKRTSDMAETLATYRAAGFDYDETIQNFVYGIIGAYYELLNADADVKSALSAQTVAKTAHDTAKKKYSAGSVARADVLKAETTLASRDLAVERAKNNREIAKGTLLTKLSFPASQEITIADMESQIGSDAEMKSIDELIKVAKEKRPDLLRATANKDAAWHRRNSAFLKNLPSISLTGNLGWGDDNLSGVFSPETEKINGSIGIRASMPIFAGFANMYGVRSAAASYDRASEQERNSENDAMLDVFKAYQNYKTAQTVLKQTETLLASATETERMTSGMYKVGRSTMLDWQTAQSELLDAQKQNNAAKYDLYIKRAAVALAIGEIKEELDKTQGNE